MFFWRVSSNNLLSSANSSGIFFIYSRNIIPATWLAAMLTYRHKSDMFLWMSPKTINHGGIHTLGTPRRKDGWRWHSNISATEIILKTRIATEPTIWIRKKYARCERSQFSRACEPLIFSRFCNCLCIVADYTLFRIVGGFARNTDIRNSPVATASTSECRKVPYGREERFLVDLRCVVVAAGDPFPWDLKRQRKTLVNPRLEWRETCMTPT